MEVCRSPTIHVPCFSNGNLHVCPDIHLKNVLVSCHDSFHKLSMEKFKGKYGEAEAEPVMRIDGGPLPPNVPNELVQLLCMGGRAEDMTLPEAHALLADFGEAFAPASEVRLGKDCHTPLAARPPEARFEPEAPLSYSADIWSLGIAIWDILGMQPVFESAFTTREEMVAQYIDVLGPMPTAWWDSWPGKSAFFDDLGAPAGKRELTPPLEQLFEDRIQRYRRMDDMGEYGKDEKVAILDLVRRMLAFRPEERPTCDEVMQSPWMVKWALPDLRRARKASAGNR
jgi:serine/threonine-protein kinase SRPK3